MSIVSVPEELKNAVCCLKCRKVNVQHSSETVENNKILRRCSICDGYCYIYNEFNSGISIGRTYVLLSAVYTHRVLVATTSVFVSVSNQVSKPRMWLIGIKGGARRARPKGPCQQA